MPQSTAVARLLGVRAAQLTSQRFWDNLSRLDEKAIARIEQALVHTAITQFSLNLRCLLFDAINFFTFIDSFNLRATPATRSRQGGRANLSIVGLALAVTADGEVPLFHHCYAGDQHDSTTFGEVLEDLTGRCRALTPGTSDVWCLTRAITLKATSSASPARGCTSSARWYRPNIRSS